MSYITIYNSPDTTEIGILKNLFDSEGIDYNIIGEATTASAGVAGTGITGMRVQVKEEDRERAKEILLQSGFLGHQKPAASRKNGPTVNKWVLVLLAALVLVIVAFLITWFMNAAD